MNKTIAALLLMVFGSLLYAAENKQAQQLDQAIGKVIQKSEYQWRLPHEKNELPDKSFLARAMESLNRYLMKGISVVKKWIEAIQRWLLKHSPTRSGPPAGGGGFSAAAQRWLLIALSALVAAILLYTLWRVRKGRSQPEIIAQPVAAVPDLNKEDVAANELPEEGWQSLAQELMQRGELRLALRAFYMSCLAFLARSELITVARFKSNKEYEKELIRRAHSYANLLDAFSENLVVFERSWYGDHEVTGDLLKHFVSNQQRIKESVKPEAVYAQ
jgi:hypothetical protein